MSVELMHPDGMLRQNDYAPVAVGTGSRIVLLAGQAGVAPDFTPAATDLAGQMYEALRNVIIGVRGAGGDVTDLARLTIYVVDLVPEMWEDMLVGIERSQRIDGLPSPTPPLTVIGVQALFTPDFFVEIEATAILD
jgi:enamine deaminase RidA (YjgF/YER057c/UK114 family)